MTHEHVEALKYRAAGLSVIPIRLDGSKAPALEVGEIYTYRVRLATDAELARWFYWPGCTGIGAVAVQSLDTSRFSILRRMRRSALGAGCYQPRSAPR